jgi:hypothetical protein
MMRGPRIPSTWGCRDDWQRAIQLIGRGVSYQPPHKFDARENHDKPRDGDNYRDHTG